MKHPRFCYWCFLSVQIILQILMVIVAVIDLNYHYDANWPIIAPVWITSTIIFQFLLEMAYKTLKEVNHKP